MSRTLEALFQSKARVKLLKFLFLNNGGKGYTIREISKRIRERPEVARREIKNLIKVGLVMKKN